MVLDSLLGGGVRMLPVCEDCPYYVSQLLRPTLCLGEDGADLRGLQGGLCHEGVFRAREA